MMKVLALASRSRSAAVGACSSIEASTPNLVSIPTLDWNRAGGRPRNSQSPAKQQFRVFVARNSALQQRAWDDFLFVFVFLGGDWRRKESNQGQTEERKWN